MFEGPPVVSIPITEYVCLHQESVTFGIFPSERESLSTNAVHVHHSVVLSVITPNGIFSLPVVALSVADEHKMKFDNDVSRGSRSADDMDDDKLDSGASIVSMLRDSLSYNYWLVTLDGN